MHQFPADTVTRQKWVKFVQRHRKDFSNPMSKYVSICSAHFDKACYERGYSAMAREGIEIEAVLKKGAIPTLDSVVPQAPKKITERQKRMV